MSKELIRLVNCRMDFDGETVLDSINIYFNNSEFLTLLGPSGCGKTTTLRIIGGFLQPTSGDVLFDGVRINDVPPHKRRINTVFQKYALFPHLNVFDNIAFGLKIKKLDKRVIEEKVNAMLELVNLKGYGKRYVGSALLNLVTRNEDDDGNAAGKGATVSDEQAKAIETAIKFKDIPAERFCAKYKIAQIADLPALSFDRAMDAIKRHSA